MAWKRWVGEIRHDVHAFVRYADDVDTAWMDQVEDDVPVLRIAVIAVVNVAAMFAQLWVFSQPGKTPFQAFEVLVTLCFTVLVLSV